MYVSTIFSFRGFSGLLKFQNFLQYFCSEQIGDTLWHKIYLSSYQSYFYHKKTKKSQWSIPDEISDIVKSMQGIIYINFII